MDDVDSKTQLLSNFVWMVAADAYAVRLGRVLGGVSWQLRAAVDRP